MAWLLHELPGRLRISEPAIKAHPARAAALAAELRGLPGVTRASANPVTGSVVVEFAGARGPILDALRLQAALPAPSALGAIESLATALADRLLEHAVRAAVTALI